MNNINEADVTALVIDQHLGQQHLEHLIANRDTDHAVPERNYFWSGRPNGDGDRVFIALMATTTEEPQLTIDVRDSDDEPVVETGSLLLTACAPELASAIVAAALLSFETLGRI